MVARTIFEMLEGLSFSADLERALPLSIKITFLVETSKMTLFRVSF